MEGAVNPASIAISLAIGTSLLGGMFSIWIAMRAGTGAAVKRDTTVLILFGIACLLILLNATAAALIAACGMAYPGRLKAAFLLTWVFAVAGVVFGLLRGLRSASAVKTQRA